ncbi:MAG: autotransporter-associated beta strand repeat-containing protein, partial [Pirellulales bacterium]|nr:autotransporter-associated beta strand repeat-containing protein [Pirellulales bacterium]
MRNDPIRWRLFLSSLAVLTTVAWLAPAIATADSFDWRNVAGLNWNTPVKSQFSGTCWAFGPTGSFEAKYKLTRNDYSFNPDCSEQQLVWEDDPDLGSTAGGGGFVPMVSYMTNHGIVSEAEVPKYWDSAYWDHPNPADPDDGWPLADGWESRVWRATGYETNLSNNIADLKNAIKTKGPLILGMNASDLYGSVSSLIANYEPHSNTDNHSVSLVGYCDDAGTPTGGYWIIKNSWGTGGGQSGYYYAPYSSSLEGCNHLFAVKGVYYTGSMVDVTWTGGTSYWYTGDNHWTTGSGNYSWQNQETTATFNTAGNAVTLLTSIIAHGLVFNAGATGFTFSGSALTVTGGGIAAHESVAINSPVFVGAPQTWTVDGGKTLSLGGALHTVVSDLTFDGAGNTTIAGPIDGGGVINIYGGAAPGNLVKKGTGTLTLSGPSNYSGSISLQGGTLGFAPAAGVTATYSGKISDGTSDIPIVKSGAGTVILTNTGNTYTGSTTISEGALQA